MTVQDLMSRFNGNQKFIMITKGDISAPLYIDELDDKVVLKREVVHWSADKRTIYVDVL